MGCRWRYWCPDGCGKSVTAYRIGRSKDYKYKCSRCGGVFTKEEIKK